MLSGAEQREVLNTNDRPTRDVESTVENEGLANCTVTVGSNTNHPTLLKAPDGAAWVAAVHEGDSLGSDCIMRLTVAIL